MVLERHVHHMRVPQFSPSTTNQHILGSDKLSERETKKATTFTIATKISFTEMIKDFDHENYETLRIKLKGKRKEGGG